MAWNSDHNHSGHREHLNMSFYLFLLGKLIYTFLYHCKSSFAYNQKTEVFKVSPEKNGVTLTQLKEKRKKESP